MKNSNKIIDMILRVRILYSIYFCFRYLPFRQAVKIPILFFSRARIKMIGNARIIVGCNAGGRITIGEHQLNFAHGKEYTTIINRGTIYFHDGLVSIQAGGVWYISGEIHMHRDVRIGVNTQVSCYKKIEIFGTSRIAHECQIRDTNFHHLRDMITGEVKPLSNSIKIGGGCWVGNRTTIMPGTILPEYTIVGSNSLLNKDYSKSFGTHSLIAGSPAKFIKGNIERLSFVDKKLCVELTKREFSN